MPLTIDDFDARVWKGLASVGDYPDLQVRGQQMIISATVAGLRFLAEVLLELRDQVAENNRLAREFSGAASTHQHPADLVDAVARHDASGNPIR